MKQAMQAASTEQPLGTDDLALLRSLRANLSGAIIFISLISATFVLALAVFCWVVFDLGASDSRVSAVLLFCCVLAVIAGFALYWCARNIRLFLSVGAVLRHPQRFTKTVSHGGLTGVSSEDGVFRYSVGGADLPVWIPIRHANSGNLECIKSARRLDGLTHQPVVLERLDLAGAPAPLLLRADYPGYPPMVTERASTEDECREVAKWDATGIMLGALGGMLVIMLFVLLFAFGPIGALPGLIVGASGFAWIRRKMARWAAIRPRTLTVTGVVAEVLDSPVAVGRYSELQRWYRIGDRFYPTGRASPEGDTITCGSVVRMDYVDRSPRGGRILRIETL
jgi:hypothetical protein